MFSVPCPVWDMCSAQRAMHVPSQGENGGGEGDFSLTQLGAAMELVGSLVGEVVQFI